MEQPAYLILVLLDAAVGINRLAGQQLVVGIAPILVARLNAVKDLEVLPWVPATMTFFRCGTPCQWAPLMQCQNGTSVAFQRNTFLPELLEMTRQSASVMHVTFPGGHAS